MLTRVYDTYLEVIITLQDFSTVKQLFTSDWKAKDALNWIYDTYCIDENKIIDQRLIYTKVYKVKSV